MQSAGHQPAPLATCSPCTGLIGQPVSGKPHTGLQVEIFSAIPAGMVETYRCLSCGVRLQRRIWQHEPGSELWKVATA